MMQRVGRIPIVTPTQVHPLDSGGPAAPPPPPARLSTHEWGPGQPLAPAPLPPPVPLSPEQMAAIELRFQDLIALGREKKIEELIIKLQRLPLPAAMRGDLDEWLQTFETIPSYEELTRFVALVVLSQRILPSALLSAKTPAEKGEVFLLDDPCRAIMQSMLPPSANLDKLLLKCSAELESSQHRALAGLLDATEDLSAILDALYQIDFQSLMGIKVNREALVAHLDKREKEANE